MHVDHLMRFALGRGETESDTCTIGRLGDVLQNGGDYRALVHALVGSDAFRYRLAARFQPRSSSMNPIRLSRRTLLRGAGIAVALPTLDAMLDSKGLLHGTASAEARKPPTRLVIFFIPNGCFDG